ncbi:MAG: glycosyltransferase family 39 protein [Chloroflexi bacterium]|nr:glycosyltransferase family 39 protein [Chloroflexota bacterium]
MAATDVGVTVSSAASTAPTRAVGVLILVLTLALALRLVSLTDIPPNVTADEADNLQTVYHILANQGPGFFGLDWKPGPAFSTYVISYFMRVFGTSIVGMRMASVVLSTLSLIALYLVARQALSKPASLASTFLLGTSLWYLHFSRSGWENVHIGLYALLATLTLVLAIKRGSWYLYAATGFFAALGLYGYMSGRAIIAVVVIYLSVALILHRQGRRRMLLGFAVMAVVCASLFAPMLKTVLDDWDLFNRRIDSVSALNTSEEYMGDRGLPKIIAHQVWRNFDGFILLNSERFKGGLNARYLPPDWAVLDRITGVLFWLGLLVSFFRWRQTILWWTMLLVMLFPIQVFSTGTPDDVRAGGAALKYDDTLAIVARDDVPGCGVGPPNRIVGGIEDKHAVETVAQVGGAGDVGADEVAFDHIAAVGP